MKTFTDYEILMVYLKECEDKQLENDILSSPEACKRLAELEIKMGHIENNLNQGNLAHDYGSQLWNNIVNQLEQPKKLSWFEKLLRMAFRPSFSKVGLVAVFVASVSFYFIGKNQTELDSQVNSNQLLSQSMQLYLAQTDVYLTQIKNMPTQSHSPMMLTTAKQLLASNRIFKAAISNNKNKQIKRLLTEIEQLLTELANSRPEQPNNYIHDYSSELLFKVKSTSNKLKREQITDQQREMQTTAI
jgi:hypothetical protein